MIDDDSEMQDDRSALSSSINCRLDKAMTRWQNVSSPPWRMQVNVIEICYEIMAEDRDVRSLILPTAALPLPLTTTVGL